MDNSRFFKVIIIILLLINISTLVFIWMQRPPAGPGHGPGGGDAADFLTRELQLDAKQREQYKQLREEHQQQIRAIHENGREFHHQFFALLHCANPDAVQAKKWADSISANQQQIEMATFRHFIKVRAICTPQQQTKFDEVIDEALRMMTPPPPGGHHPPPPNP